MSPLVTILIAVSINVLTLIVAAALGRGLVLKALREFEERSLQRLRGADARLREELRQLEAQVKHQAVLARKDAEAGRRAENNLLEIAKGLTAASIQIDERLQALEHKTP